MSPFQISGKWLCFFLGDIRVVVVAWLFVICCAWWMVLIKSLLYSSSFSLRVATLMDRFSQIGAQARNISRPGHKSLFRYTTTWFTITREQRRNYNDLLSKHKNNIVYHDWPSWGTKKSHKTNGWLVILFCSLVWRCCCWCCNLLFLPRQNGLGKNRVRKKLKIFSASPSRRKNQKESNVVRSKALLVLPFARTIMPWL